MVQVNVDKELVTQLLDKVYKKAEKLSVQKEQSQELKNEIVDNYKDYTEAIERAYTNAEERQELTQESEEEETE